MPNRTVADQLRMNRTWLIGFLVMQIITCLVLLLIGYGLLQTTLTNRRVGFGNRTVTCKILDRVDPTQQLAECTSVEANRR